VALNSLPLTHSTQSLKQPSQLAGCCGGGSLECQDVCFLVLLLLLLLLGWLYAGSGLQLCSSLSDH
jgi:hypothetical protein